MAYKPYRGTRARRRNRLLLVFTFFLLLLIIGGVVFFALQEHIIFTAEGFRFDFAPRGDTTTAPAAGESMPPLIIEQTTTQAPTQPTTEPAPQKRQGLTAAALVEGSAYEADLPQGADRKAVYILDRDGVARIPTTVYGDEPTTADQLTLADTLRGSGDVAILSAFRNHEGAAKARVNAVTVPSGLTWLDAGNNRWLSPYAISSRTLFPDAVTVAYHLFTTCADLGLGEVLLINFQFPTQGQLALIDWGENDNTAEGRIAAITRQAGIMRDAFDEKTAPGAPMLLSCLLTETAASAFADELAGQSVAELAQHFDILYVPTADPDFDTGPLYEVIEGTGCRIGLWLKSGTAPSREIDFILVP